MAEKSSFVAWAALFVSIASAGMSGYQWWAGRDESRINAATELSKTYLLDKEVSRRLALLWDQLASPNKGMFDRVEQMREIGSYLNFLEYIAHLANTGRIDNAYLAPQAKCDIWAISKTLAEIKNKKEIAPPFSGAEIKQVARFVQEGKASDCALRN